MPGSTSSPAAELNVRLFALPGGVPPDEWPVRTYVTTTTSRRLDAQTRRRLYAAARIARAPKRVYARLVSKCSSDRAALARTGHPRLEAGCRAHARHRSRRRVLLRHPAGSRLGSSRPLARADARRIRPRARALRHRRASRVATVMRAADCLLSDNQINFDIARAMGVHAEQLSPIGTVPGTGGVDIDALRTYSSGLPPSSRSVILWPKAYECPWSKALPVFEALCATGIACRRARFTCWRWSAETRMWFHALPPEIKASCRIDERIPRHEILQLMGRARVMLAPSLVDGTPNSMFEAMATGAFPCSRRSTRSARWCAMSRTCCSREPVS